MKKLILFLAVYCMTQSAIAGCGPPTIRTSNGIQLYPYPNSITTATVTAVDSFYIYASNMASPAHCQNAREFNVIVGQDTLVRNATWAYSSVNAFKLREIPGHYIVTFIWDWWGMPYKFRWEFDLILKPAEADTSKHETALPVNTELNPEFLLYPNPAENTISFLNESEQIKTAFIRNISGQKVAFYEINNIKADIPINDLPAGIYFLQVATVSEKVIIKKFVVQ